MNAPVYYLNPAAAQWSKLSKKRNKAVDQLAKRSLSILPQGDGSVKLQLNKPVRVGNTEIGSASLFGTNSKMKCPTFSLPAGRPAFGGTCPAEALSDTASQSGFVCNGCYAGKGQYSMYNTITISQAIRQLYTMISMDSRNFVSEMIDALSLAYDSGWAERIGKQAKYVFRIHDSGDFYSIEYLSAWLKICEHFQPPNRKILFWAPTRMWVFPKFRQTMGQSTENFVIRPSGLFVDRAVPEFPEFHVGSTVNTPGLMPGTHQDIDGSVCWICPAYRHDNPAASCESESCRRCWGKKDHVSYTEH